MKLFADDAKLFGRVNLLVQATTVQTSLDNAVDWAQIWDMNYHFQKCKHLHIGNHQGCGNTMPDLSDLVQFHSGQVENFYLLVLGQVQIYKVNKILINHYEFTCCIENIVYPDQLAS